MKATKEIDVIPHTNSGIVREVIEAMFYNSVFINEAVKTARYNYYRAKKSDFGSDIFIIFKYFGKIIEVEGTWYGNGDDSCWFEDYNWYVKIKDKPTDWDYEYFNLDSLYSFNPNFI